MNTIIIGNGIIAQTTALRLAVAAKPGDKITIIGKKSKPNSATNAAAAMLNSFCEIETDTFKTEIDSVRFEMSYEATKMWHQFVLDHLEIAMQHKCLVDECETCMGSSGACFELGTYLVNNCATDNLDDSNYDAVVKALKDFYEPYSEVDPKTIPNYMPEARSRATRAIYIPNEGWLNPKLTLRSIEASLAGFDCIEFIDDNVIRINHENSKITSVICESNGKKVEGDVYFLATGASASELIVDSKLPITIPRIFKSVGVSIQIKSPDFPHTKAIRTPNRGLACGIYTVPFYTGPKVPLNEIIIGASSYVTPYKNVGARVGSVQYLLDSAMDQVNVNFYKAEISCINVGYRPLSADTYPVFGKSDSIPNLVICTGTKRDGFHLSPLLSKLLAALILGEKIDEKYDAFKPERKLIRPYTREEAIEAGVKHMLNANYQHGFTPSQDRMLSKIQEMYRQDLEKLHDKVGAYDWGIPAELFDMYRYDHIKSSD